MLAFSTYQVGFTWHVAAPGEEACPFVHFCPMARCCWLTRRKTWPGNFKRDPDKVCSTTTCGVRRSAPEVTKSFNAWGKKTPPEETGNRQTSRTSAKTGLHLSTRAAIALRHGALRFGPPAAAGDDGARGPAGNCAGTVVRPAAFLCHR